MNTRVLFTPEAIKECGTWAIVGKRRSGKTGWARYLCTYLACQLFVIVAGSTECRMEWRLVVPDLFIIDKDPRVIQNIITHQNELVMREGHVPDDRKVCLIFDDCGCEKKFMNHTFMYDLFANGRHYGLTIILAMQAFNQLHLQNRANLDYMCLLNAPNQSDLKKIFTEYGGTHTKKDMLAHIVQAVAGVSGVDYEHFSPDETDHSPRRGMCIIDNTNSDGTRLYSMLHSQERHNNPTPLMTLPPDVHVVPCSTLKNNNQDGSAIMFNIQGRTHQLVHTAGMRRDTSPNHGQHLKN